MDDENGWVGLGGVGQRLANLAPDFDPRTYGHAKLGDLVSKTGAFEVDQPEGRGTVRIRLKPSPKGQAGRQVDRRWRPPGPVRTGFRRLPGSTCIGYRAAQVSTLRSMAAAWSGSSTNSASSDSLSMPVSTAMRSPVERSAGQLFVYRRQFAR